MTSHIEGEEEQLEAVEPLIVAAMIGVREITGAQSDLDHVEQAIRWLARESFRLGNRHAHKRSTARPKEPERKFSSTAQTKRLKR